jgi:hypothetical protein
VTSLFNKWLQFVSLALVCLAGCAHGSDGARQAEAAANAAIGAGYRSLNVYANAESKVIQEMAQAGNPAAAQEKLDALRALSKKAFATLDTASEGVDAVDAAIGIAEAAKSKDYSQIVAKLLQIGADVVNGLRSLGVKVGL